MACCNIQSFFDFCPSDRVGFIVVFLLAIFAGYVFGTGGHWNRFYWKKKFVSSEDRE